MAVLPQPTGTINGSSTTIVRHQSAQGTPVVEQLAARGTLNGLGKVSLQGTLTEGRPAAGLFPFSGRLALRDARGTIMLAVSGTRAMSTTSAIRLDYTVVGGTGRDRGATGSGQIVLTEFPSPLSPHAKSHPAYLSFYLTTVSPVALNGVFTGYSSQTNISDPSTPIEATGTYQGVGAITHAATTVDVGIEPNSILGTVTLNDGTGTLTLEQVPSTPGTGLVYRVTGGTGRFATASGTVDVSYSLGTTSNPTGIGGGSQYLVRMVLGDGGLQADFPFG